MQNSSGADPKTPAIIGKIQTSSSRPDFVLFFLKKKKKSAVTFSQSFINSDCFHLGIDPGDTFLIFDVHKYVPFITLVQCFITNTIVLVGNPPLYKEGALI